MSEDIKTRIARQAEAARAAAGTGAPAPVKKEPVKFGLGNVMEEYDDYMRPESYLYRELLCIYDHMPVSMVVPPFTTVTFTMVPFVGWIWFCTVAWRVNVRDELDCALAADAWILGAVIGLCNLFSFPPTTLNFPPTAPPVYPASIQFIRASDLDPDDYCACPTADWPAFSNTGLGCTLTILVYNPRPQSTRVTIDLLGYGLGACPDCRTVKAAINAGMLPAAPIAAA